MPKHIFDKLNAKVLAEKEEIQQGLCVAKNSIPEPIDFQKKVSTLRKVISMLDDPESSVPELNAMLKTCIERIIYRRPKVQGISSRWQTGGNIELDVALKINNNFIATIVIISVLTRLPGGLFSFTQWSDNLKEITTVGVFLQDEASSL